MASKPSKGAATPKMPMPKMPPKMPMPAMDALPMKGKSGK